MGAWLRGGWHVMLAYVLGLTVLLLTLGWHPPQRAAAAPASHSMEATAP